MKNFSHQPARPQPQRGARAPACRQAGPRVHRSAPACRQAGLADRPLRLLAPTCSHLRLFPMKIFSHEHATLPSGRASRCCGMRAGASAMRDVRPPVVPWSVVSFSAIPPSVSICVHPWLKNFAPWHLCDFALMPFRGQKSGELASIHVNPCNCDTCTWLRLIATTCG